MKSSIPHLFTSSKVDLMLKTSDNQLKAELLGNFFSSVFVKEPSWTWDLNVEDKPTITEHLSIEITKEVILQKINELNTNKSPGPDNMHPRVVNEHVAVIVHPFYLIFNMSLKTGKVPSA